jgi:hypothetical protein
MKDEKRQVEFDAGFAILRKPLQKTAKWKNKIEYLVIGVLGLNAFVHGEKQGLDVRQQINGLGHQARLLLLRVLVNHSHVSTKKKAREKKRKRNANKIEGYVRAQARKRET